MSTSKPASLDGSLLARKGDAAPAIPSDSPLLEELGEPRPNRPGGPSGTGNPVAGAPSAVLGLIGHGLAWLAGHRVYGVLGLAIGMAILFAVTIAALTPSPDAVLAPAPPAPAASTVAPEKIIIPTDGESMTKPSDVVVEAAIEPSETAVAPPEPTARVTLPEPPATVAEPAIKPVVVAKPSSRSGRYLLQLSAVPTAKSARRELARLEKKLGGLLGKRKIVVVKAVPPGKPPVYRLRASAYKSRAAARAACNRIRKKKMACWVVRR